MNEHDESEKAPPPIPATSASSSRVAATKPLSYWARRFLVCNPFYLVSAALLLFGLYRVSVDPTFARKEIAQLAFNLSSLQLYELLLVLTAIVLARRCIWYESTLLAGLENMLLFVPFILISQAALINQHSLWAVCLGISAVAVFRMGLLKRYFTELNLPRRMLAIGAVLLVVNIGLLVTYRMVEETKLGGKPDSGTDYNINQLTWLVILPAALALANLLPHARERGSLLPQRRWLPAGLFALWIIATGVHLYCLNYVYDFAFRLAMMAPFCWVLAWTMYRRMPEILALPERIVRPVLIVLPVFATLTAVSHNRSAVFFALTALNVAAYAAICWIERNNRLARHLLFASCILMAAGLPNLWMQSIAPDFSRGKWLTAIALAYLVLQAALSRHPKLGILGATVVGLSIAVYFERSPWAVNAALQSGLVFLLLHSLRWEDSKHDGLRIVRIIACAGWLLHSYLWTFSGDALWMPCIFGSAVLAIYLVVQLFRGGWDHHALPITATLVVLSSPVNALAGEVSSTPIGLLAVIGSFVLFGLGTATALMKHRWASNQ